MTGPVRILVVVLVVAAVAIGAFLILPGLFSEPAPSPSPTPGASGSPSASASASPSASASAGETASGAPETPPGGLPGFTCGLPISGPASVGIAHTADVRVGTHDGYDRIVFEYHETGTPAYRIAAASPPFTLDPSDLPVTVHGTTFFEIVLNGATKMGDDGSSTYTGPTEFEPGYRELAHLLERGDFESVNSWYLGLNGGTCLRAFVLSDPSRIVIDIQH